MLMIDTFIVNVAFPAIGRDLNASLSAAEWTVTGYVLMTGVFPVAAGRLGDIFGRRRVYLLGLCIFIGTSGLCGLAQNIEQLVLFRIFQGVGAATMMPLTLSIITNAFPAAQRGLAIGIWGGVSGLGLIAGPIIGGLLVMGDEWRWVFLVNIPVGVVALLLALLYVGESRDTNASRSLDWGGLVLLSAGIFLPLLGLTFGNEEGWTSPVVLGCFAAGAILLTSFRAGRAESASALVDLSLFRSWPFVMACVSAGLFSAAVFGSQPFTSLYMQNYLGFSPLEGGLAFIPATALVALLMPVSGILGQRLGPRVRFLIIGGSASVGISFIYLLGLDIDSGYVDGFLPAFVLRGLGIGLVMSATSYAVVSAMPMQKSGLASGTLTMARNIGTSVGVAVFGAVFLHSIDTKLPGELEAAGVSGTEAAAHVEAAHHFVPAPEGDPARQTTQEAIVDGFLTISAVGLGVSVLAASAAVAIRYRRSTAVAEPAPSAVAAIPGR
jgi:EmrB/QacA subfamily drug resistance transporter